MALFICDITALEIYRANRFRSFEAPLHARAARRAFCAGQGAVPANEVRSVNLRRYGIRADFDSLHVLVPSDSAKNNGKGACCHVWSGGVSAGMFTQLEPGVFVVTPEFLFAQMAVGRTLPSLVELGMELCGRYETSSYAFLGSQRPDALSNVAKLQGFLRANAGAYGVTKAEKALRHVVENSWSPMETATCILLCLPRAMGGFGMPKPLMNACFELPEFARPADGRRFLYCDMYWPEARFAVEYDGKASHFDAALSVRDKRRLAALSSLGIDAISLCAADVLDYDAMESAAAKVARRLGVERKDPSARMLSRRVQLRKELLSFG